MKTVQPFIDLGFYVVPMVGQIRRDKLTGKKLCQFPPDWKQHYLEVPYNPKAEGKEVPIAGAFIAGSRSNAISIDCDNQQTFDLFKALDPDYHFIFMSKDKKAGGGSIIYKLNDQYKDIPSFRIHLDNIQIDYQTDDLLQFLPSIGNKSKEEWRAETIEEMPELREPPELVIQQLRALYILNDRSKQLVKEGRVTKGAEQQHYKLLAPFLETFVSTGKFMPDLFRILTPNEGGFRQLEQYKDERTLHPDNVPDGMGNDYLMRVMGIFVCDQSVSPRLFKKAVEAVNNLWSSPYPNDQLQSLIRHELNRPEWVYNSDWKDIVDVILTDYNTLVNVFYDPITKIYYALDTKFGMLTFSSPELLTKHLSSIVKGGRVYKSNEVYGYLENKELVLTPLEEPGELEPKSEDVQLKRYNIFARNKAYDVLLNPEKYKNEFEGRIPYTTINFFEHLIPDKETREYVLRFVLTKLVTLKHSEVVLYFLGKMGAGKNLFIDWLKEITSNSIDNMHNSNYEMTIEVDLENFLAKYNMWILNALFANLDEYGEKTAGKSQDRQVLAQLKSYTGKEVFQLRTMQSDPIPAKHKCTFIMTANENKLSPDTDDRRLVMIETPLKLEEAMYVKAMGGKSKAVAKMFEELPLFCYYWVTNYSVLSRDEFRTPPATKFKKEVIMRNLSPSKKIVAMLKDNNIEGLYLLSTEYDLGKDFLEGGKVNAVSKPFLIELFQAMTEGTNVKKSVLDTEFRKENLEFVRKRFGKRNTYGYELEGLRDFASKIKMEDGVLLAEDIEEPSLEL